MFAFNWRKFNSKFPTQTCTYIENDVVCTQLNRRGFYFIFWAMLES